MLKTYQPSGKYTSSTFLLVPAATAAAAMLGLVYQLILHFVPFIYLDFFAACGLGIAIAWILAKIFQLGKCRNVAVAATIGAIAGIAALAAAHALDMYLNLQGHWAPFFAYLDAKANIGYIVGKHGSGMPIKGVFAYVVWVIEAAIVVGLAAAGGAAGGGQPYCERCDRHVGEKPTTESGGAAFALQSVDAATAQRVAGAKELADVIDIPLERPLGPLQLIYSLSCCGTCREIGFLTVQLKELAQESSGKKSKDKVTDLHKHLQLSADEMQVVRALGSVARAPLPKMNAV